MPTDTSRNGGGDTVVTLRNSDDLHAIYELLEITPAIRSLIVPGADAGALQEVAEREGMITITANAVALARKGVISLQEAFGLRVE